MSEFDYSRYTALFYCVIQRGQAYMFLECIKPISMIFLFTLISKMYLLNYFLYFLHLNIFCSEKEANNCHDVQVSNLSIPINMQLSI